MYDNVFGSSNTREETKEQEGKRENGKKNTDAHDTIRAWIRAIFLRSICHLVTISTGASIFFCDVTPSHVKSQTRRRYKKKISSAAGTRAEKRHRNENTLTKKRYNISFLWCVQREGGREWVRVRIHTISSLNITISLRIFYHITSK